MRTAAGLAVVEVDSITERRFQSRGGLILAVTIIAVIVLLILIGLLNFNVN